MSDVDPRLETSVAGLGTVVSFELREALDRPYLLRLRLTGGDQVIDTEAALEEDLAIEYGRREATRRRVVGMILRIADGSRDFPEQSTVLEIGPALNLLALERQSRIFQEKTVPDILREVLEASLGPYGRSVDIQLDATYEPREYCVQWQETNLDFVQRLMAEEGITYHFDHSGASEVLALRDKNDQHPELAANDGATVFYRPHEDLTGGVLGEAITSFRLRERLGRTHVAVRDHDWTGPRAVEGSAGEADAMGRERESFEHALGVTLSIGSYDEGARRYQKDDAASQPGIRSEADRAGLRVFEAESLVPSIAAGHVFDLSGEPSGLDGRYLVTEAEYRCDRLERELPSRFACISLDVPHHPARIQTKPRITSAEVATVVGPAGQEIHTDAHGRIKVRFPWDRAGSEDPGASCWIRVAQRWAGEGFGTMHIPRIGMEVVVRFLNGDPDRPIVTGTLYNGANTPPYALPAEKTKSTIKSNSSIGGGGFNEFRYEDKAGREQIYLHAQKDHDEVVLANHSTTVGNDQKNTVHNDQTQTIHKNQKEDVHGDQIMRVQGKRDVNVFSGFDEKVDGTETRTVKPDVTEVIIGTNERKVKGDVAEIVTDGELRVVIGGQTEENHTKHTRAVVGGALRVHTGAFSHSSKGSAKLVSGSMVNSVILGSLTATGGPLIELQAPVIIEISNQHTKTPGATTITSTAIKVSIMALTAAATGAKASTGYVGATLTGISVSATGAKAAANGFNCGLSLGSWGSTYASKTKLLGVFILKGGFQVVI